MQVDTTIAGAAALQSTSKALDNIDAARKDRIKEQPDPGGSDSGSDMGVQPEELLNQIKALTEDGLYSVRFENNTEFDELVVKVVDTATDEVIRQVPAEEILGMRAQLEELRGKIVNTTR